jgi:hypothetical protein
VDNGPKQYNFLTYEKLTCMAKVLLLSTLPFHTHGLC